MNKKVFIPIIIVLLLGTAAYLVFAKNDDANNETPELIESPAQNVTVNTLPLAQRPFVQLIPHENTARCGGVDMRIEKLLNGETKTEYELEYRTDTMIQGVFGNREFTDKNKEYAPLEFGTCSAGKCKCDDENIVSGTLKLSFNGKSNYVLKEDFGYNNTTKNTEGMVSGDRRLTVIPGDALTKNTDVIIGSTFGLPSQLSSKVLKGPYGIFVEGKEIGDKLNAEMTYHLQSPEAETGKIQLWDGESWQNIEFEFVDGKAIYKTDILGVIVVTE